MTISCPDPTLFIIQVTELLVLRVTLVGDRTFSGWFYDGEPAGDPELSAEA